MIDNEAIENSLHWCLDVTFNEDLRRISSGHAQKARDFYQRVLGLEGICVK